MVLDVFTDQLMHFTDKYHLNSRVMLANLKVRNTFDLTKHQKHGNSK